MAFKICIELLFVLDEFDGIIREGLPEGKIMYKWMEADGFCSVEGDVKLAVIT